MRQTILACVLSLIFVGGIPAGAQSLDRKSPAPLQSGVNRGTVDNFVGGHYWTFQAGPGKIEIPIRYIPGTVLGAAVNSQLTFSLMSNGKVLQTKVLQSPNGQPVSDKFFGPVPKKSRFLIAVEPAKNALVRLGGDYEITVTGAVAFDPAREPSVVHTYKVMGGYTQDLGMAKFLPDGRIETAAGPGGTWKLFDANSQSYVIDIQGQERRSLHYVPGRGLCDAGDTNPAFQEMP